MPTDPDLELSLKPLDRDAHTVGEWLTTFNLVFVALDPYTNESAWILDTAGRILEVFEGADCRVAWVVACDEDGAKEFLGPWSERILTFVDPDRSVVNGFGLQRLPAFVHVAIDGTVVAAAEGWDPDEWSAVAQDLARRMSWRAPTIPIAGDPRPYAGSPASG